MPTAPVTSPVAALLSPESIAVLAFGLLLVALGVALVRRHRTLWAVRRDDPTLDEAARTFYHRQHRRRMRTSGLIILLGALLPLGDLYFERRPAAQLAWAFYWLSVLALVGVLVLFALVDLAATATHARGEMARLRSRREELEGELRDLRRELRGDAPADGRDVR